jgi:hypothetical protein
MLDSVEQTQISFDGWLSRITENIMTNHASLEKKIDRILKAKQAQAAEFKLLSLTSDPQEQETPPDNDHLDMVDPSGDKSHDKDVPCSQATIQEQIDESLCYYFPEPKNEEKETVKEQCGLIVNDQKAPEQDQPADQALALVKQYVSNFPFIFPTE